MATISFFNHTASLLTTGAITSTNTFSVVLLNDSFSMDATDVTVDEVTASGSYEVYGNNWPQNGVTISNISITNNSGNWKLDGDDVSVSITGGNLGPFYNYLVAMDDGVSDPYPLYVVDLEGGTTVLQNNIAEIVWDTSGILAVNKGA